MRQDRQWIKRIGRGDSDALRDVYLAYKDDLLTIAMCMVGRPAAAEDVLHDVFVRFAGGVSVRGSLRSYLVASVANRARDYLRSQGRRNQLHPVTLDDAPPAVADGAEPVDDLIGREQARRAHAALRQLPHEQREVITLRIHGAMKFRQIAAALGVPPNTVRSRYRYGIEKLRALLHGGDHA